VTSRFYGGSPIRNGMGGGERESTWKRGAGGGERVKEGEEKDIMAYQVGKAACSPLYSYFFVLLDVRSNGVYLFSLLVANYSLSGIL